tara:strand:+ start:798 stop:1238 length:441 start_codon:yes stop_codon:yes gene_type:complete
MSNVPICSILPEDVFNIIFNISLNLNLLRCNKFLNNIKNYNKQSIENIKNNYFFTIFENVFSEKHSPKIHEYGLIKTSKKLPIRNKHFINFINNYNNKFELFNDILITYTTVTYRCIDVTVNTIINNLLKNNYPDLFLPQINNLNI